MMNRASLNSLLGILATAVMLALPATLKAGQPFNSGAQFVPHELLVKFKAGTPDFVRADIHRGVSATVLRRFHADPQLEHVLLPAGENLDAALAYYSTRADVEYAQKNFVYHVTDTTPNDTFINGQWGFINSLSGVDAPAAWDKSKGRFSTVIAVIDTGVDYTHPDLGLNIWTNPGEAGVKCLNGADSDSDGYVDDCRGWNFWSNTNDPMDDNGHGTHIAGTIGALTNNNMGVAGANWNVQIMPLKITDANGNGTTALAVQALDYALAHGAKIANFSLGGAAFDPAFLEAVQRADAAGVLFVTAAGNGGLDDDSTPFYPCTFSQYDAVNNPNPPGNILCVAATDINYNLASYSNYGLATVQLGAPGDGIASTWIWNGFQYLVTSGTSEAAPFVSGGAGLVAACNPSLSSATIKTILMNTARADTPALGGKTSTGGVVDYAAALNDSRVGACAPAPTGSSPVSRAGGPYSNNMKKSVQFDGSDSTDKGGQLLIYYWSFGDGQYGVGARVNHAYASPGIYTLTLTVRDNNGAESSDSTTVTVHSTGPSGPTGPPGK